MTQDLKTCKEVVKNQSDEKLESLINSALDKAVSDSSIEIQNLFAVSTAKAKIAKNKAEMDLIAAEIKKELSGLLNTKISVFDDQFFQELTRQREKLIDIESNKIKDPEARDECQSKKSSKEYSRQPIATAILKLSTERANELAAAFDGQFPIHDKVKVISNKPKPELAIPATNTNTTIQVEVPQPPSEESGTMLPIAVVSATLLSLLVASLVFRRLYDRWRYGPNAGKNLGSLKNAVSAKNELTKKWLRRKKSANIHAIGVGKIDGTDDYCIQVFVEDANGEMLEDPPTQLLPTEFRDLPIVIFEMPRADFLAADVTEARASHDILKGGISGANANLSGEVGTIGYFFRPNFVDKAIHIFLKNHVYLLSNAHVFSDVTREEIAPNDLIAQPSPGDIGAKRLVAALYAKSSIRFDGDVENPNLLDAAIAKINNGISHALEIPGIGEVAGYLKKEQVELRSECSKFGRTTGFTCGMVFSIHLSIWVKYSARGKEALFGDQFLIVPTDGSSFVKGGDSGSLLVDNQNQALGLIFAGAGEKTLLKFTDADGADLQNLAATPKIENYGVANSISDVMSHFKIKLDE